MLATLTDEHFSDADWIFERKLDGERCIAVRKRHRVTLYSRNHNSLNATYPELVEALEGQSASGYIVDGEIVAFDGNLTSFSRLQQRMQSTRTRKTAESDKPSVYFYLFDICYAEGRDLSRVPLRYRKTALKNLLDFTDPLRLTAYRCEHGSQLYRQACRKGWEGLIAKRYNGIYRHGRSKDWLKFKCVGRQELIVVGFTDPDGQRPGFGALLVGYHSGDVLRYAGKVGTGFDHDTLKTLRRKMDKLKRKSPPVAEENLPAGGVHWISPQLVAEIGFTEWTDKGRLRHPRFIGLRRDKPASEVKRERPHS